MNYEFPLVFFTVLTQLAVGVAVFAALKELGLPACTADGARSTRKDWLMVAAAALLGLTASLFHLAHPLRAATALDNLGVSWLSREGLVFGLFAGLACLNCVKANRALAVAAALTGCAGIAMQGMTYAVISMPAISNGVPMLLFALASLSMGAVVRQGMDKTLRVALILLIASLLAVPVISSMGGTVLRATAQAWLESPLFWAGLALLAAAFGLTFAKKRHASIEIACVLCAVFLSRIVFFRDTLHTASMLGMPY